MRPVKRGTSPIPASIADYREAFPFLTERLGKYCSYCERRIEASLAVEHILPKVKYPHLKRDWTNFLLACANCNSTKSETKPEDTLLPDIHNTFYAFAYDELGGVLPNSSLSATETNQAQNMLNLVKLERRMIDRFEKWDTAQKQFTKLQKEDTPIVRSLIVDTARASGHFSVWMTVFASDSDMLLRFIEAFPGTARECFDPTTGHTIAKVTR